MYQGREKRYQAFHACTFYIPGSLGMRLKWGREEEVQPHSQALPGPSFWSLVAWRGNACMAGRSLMMLGGHIRFTSFVLISFECTGKKRGLFVRHHLVSVPDPKPTPVQTDPRPSPPYLHTGSDQLLEMAKTWERGQCKYTQWSKPLILFICWSVCQRTRTYSI